ncbi:MAG: AMP-binding protein [Candidatus Thorarchaeota archaeon]
MKDYSEWKPILDYENESPYIENPNRTWLKLKSPKVPKSIKFEPIPLHEFLKLSARKFPNNILVYHKPTDKKYTYRELIYYADRIANALHELGIKKGDAVGLMSINCPEFLFCVLGILETGASLVPINPLLKESEVSHIIKDAGNINTVFVHKNNFRTIKKTLNEVEISNIILLAAEETKPNTITLEELIKDKASKPPDVDIDPINDVAALLFTGGTTGLPKGVMLTHNNLVSNALSILYNSESSYDEVEELKGTTVVLSILPLCHSFGFVVVNTAMYAAEMLVIFDSFEPSEIMEAIEFYRIPLFVGVPVMYQMIINHPEFTERDLSSIEGSVSSAATLAPEFARKWEQVIGTKIGQGYGLTEASPATHLPAAWLPEVRPESVGVPILDTDSKIVNPDTLEEVKIGEVGEILIKGPQIMKGYWNRPEDTKRDIVNGWLRTGDLGRIDEQGYFYIEGRTKEMIKYKGYKVMPKEVEEKLFEHPAIADVGVVGIPDPNIGETIKAFIVLNPEYKDKVTEEDIIEWAKERLAGYKYPRQVEFIKSLPRTTIGKVFRLKLREMELKKKEKPLAPL